MMSKNVVNGIRKAINHIVVDKTFLNYSLLYAKSQTMSQMTVLAKTFTVIKMKNPVFHPVIDALNLYNKGIISGKNNNFLYAS